MSMSRDHHMKPCPFCGCADIGMTSEGGLTYKEHPEQGGYEVFLSDDCDSSTDIYGNGRICMREYSPFVAVVVSDDDWGAVPVEGNPYQRLADRWNAWVDACNADADFKDRFHFKQRESRRGESNEVDRFRTEIALSIFERSELEGDIHEKTTPIPTQKRL